jgi:WD40 repeat protein
MLPRKRTLLRCAVAVVGVAWFVLTAGGADKEEPKPREVPRTDLHGDPLPPGVVARLGSSRLRHFGGVFAFAFTPDGKAIVSGGGDKTLRFWDAETGKEKRQLRCDSSSVTHLAFTPDGKTLAVVTSNEEILLWDVAEGKQLRRLVGHKPWIMSVAVTPDGSKLLTSSRDQTVRVWDIATGKELLVFREHTRPRGGVGGIAVSPDGKIVASGDWGDANATEVEVLLWNLDSGKVLRRLGGHIGRIQTLDFSPDGKTLAVTTSWSSHIRLWQVDSGDKIVDLAEKGSRYNAAAFSEDGKTVIGVGSSVIHHWDWRARRIVQATAVENVKHVLDEGFSPNKRVVGFIAEGRIRLWDLATGKESIVLPGHQRPVWAVAFSPDGRWAATGSEDGTVRLWDARTGRELRTMEKDGGPMISLSFAPDGKTLAGGGEPFEPGTDEPRASLWLWDPDTGKPLYSARRHASAVRGLAFTPDSKAVFTASAEGVHCWDVPSGKELPVPDRDHGLECVAVSPDGKFLAVGGASEDVRRKLGDRKRIRLWSLERKEELPAPPVADRWTRVICSLAFSPDGKFLAGGDNIGVLTLWDVAAGVQIRETPDVPGSSRLRVIAFSPDGRLLAVADDCQTDVRILEAATAQEVVRLKGHQAQVNSVAFGVDGRTILSASVDCTALVWDLWAVLRTEHRLVEALGPKELNRLWDELGDPKSSVGLRAVHTLVEAPKEAAQFLKDRLKPEPARDLARIRRLIADLDDDRFVAREGASQELAKLGVLAEPELRQALRDGGSVERSTRVEAILSALNPHAATPGRLRQMRAVQTLEYINSPESRRLLETLAEGETLAGQTSDARGALKRLKHRPLAR